MAYQYGKKSLSEKFSQAARKFILATMAAATIGAAGYYEYGTVQEQTVKVTRMQSDGEGEDRTALVETESGASFIIEKSALHLQKTANVDRTYNFMNVDRTYRIKTYGMHMIGTWQPNILSARELTEKEIAEIEAAKLPKKAAATPPVTAPVAAPPHTETPPQTFMTEELGTYTQEVPDPATGKSYILTYKAPVSVVESGRLTFKGVEVAPPKPQRISPAPGQG